MSCWIFSHFLESKITLVHSSNKYFHTTNQFLQKNKYVYNYTFSFKYNKIINTAQKKLCS